MLLWMGDNIDMVKRFFFSGFESVEFLILKSDTAADDDVWTGKSTAWLSNPWLILKN